MPKVKLLEAVTFAGAHILAGEVIELSEVSAKALIEERKAEAVKAAKTPSKVGKDPGGNNDTGDGVKTPIEGKDGGENGEGDKEPIEPTEEEKIFKALDSQYADADAIREAAKAAGIEVAWNAKKETIINKVIEDGQADLLLK